MRLLDLPKGPHEAGLMRERLVRLDEAAALLPTRPHVATIRRWAGRGVGGPGGARLETVLIGGRRCTSIEALERFVARCGGESAPEPEAGASAPGGERGGGGSIRTERLRRELERAGLTVRGGKGAAR